MRYDKRIAVFLVNEIIENFYLYNVAILNKSIIFVDIDTNININTNDECDMASINQLISEIAHSVQQADSVPVRRALKLGIIHARNELIRKSYDNNKITDKVLQQRFKLSLINVPDGDQSGTKDLVLPKVKRTTHKVPRPVRLSHNLPFHSVRTAGVGNPIEIAFAKEASSKFYGSLPGMCPVVTYDYINEYIYIDIIRNNSLAQLNSIIVESVFEYPHLIQTETIEGKLNLDDINDDDEFLLPEDMIGVVKKLVLETFNAQVVRQTNEIPTPNLVK